MGEASPLWGSSPTPPPTGMGSVKLLSELSPLGFCVPGQAPDSALEPVSEVQKSPCPPPRAEGTVGQHILSQLNRGPCKSWASSIATRSPRKGNTFEKASFRGLTRSGRCYSITWKRLEGDSHPPTPLGPQPRAARPPSSRWPACPVPPGRILRAPQAPSAECHLTSGGHTLFSPPTSRRAWPPPSGQPTAPS